MASVVQRNFRIRHNFGSVEQLVDIPNLINLQKLSYDRFLQLGVSPEDREDIGLQGVFKTVFPIEDYHKKIKLEFVSYKLEEPKNSIAECLQRALSYQAQIKVKLKCTRRYDEGDEIPEGGSTLREEEPEVYFGEIPLQTKEGTFIINGTERVIVSQLHRSAGAFFDHDGRKKQKSGSEKLIFNARVIPYRGSWLDFEFDTKDLLKVSIDRRRKMPATILLRALGYTPDQIMALFYPIERLRFDAALTEEHGTTSVKEEQGEEDSAEVELPLAVYRRFHSAELLSDLKVIGDVTDKKGKSIFRTKSRGKGLNKGNITRIQKLGITEVPLSVEFFCARFILAEQLESEDGELFAANQLLTPRLLHQIWSAGISEVPYYYIDEDNFGQSLLSTLKNDLDKEGIQEVLDAEEIEPEHIQKSLELIEAVSEYGLLVPGRDCAFDRMITDLTQQIEALHGTKDSEEEQRFAYLDIVSCDRDRLIQLISTARALESIYRRIRPGDPPTVKSAYKLLFESFFDKSRYDLGEVGRHKLNHKFELDIPIKHGTLVREDIVETVRYILALKNNNSELIREEPDGRTVHLDVRIDDIDHLGNRRVRAVGELIENQYRIGLVRMERSMREKINSNSPENHPKVTDLINQKPVNAAIREYFGSSQLSQFMDQINPLSEVTHKRRLSALGPGGLNRDRAGFEVRDVHMTHYGRICPIETPEGPNIGLIASLSTFAKVNPHGFIETPYRRVEEGRIVVEEQPKYYSALDEERSGPRQSSGNGKVAQAKTPSDEKGHFLDPKVDVRAGSDFLMVPPDEVNLIDVSPNQLVSVAAALIPFLENDDANRALMGSNMQRQAVPLMVTEAPLVGTGMEQTVGKDSGVTVVAKKSGVIESVDADRIVIKVDHDANADALELPEPEIHNLLKFRRSNQNTCINQYPIVNQGDRVEAGDIIADGPGTERGELALGRNVVVAFMPWGGYNFEDSILISETLIQEDVYTSIHIEEFECVARDTKLGAEEITRELTEVNEDALKDLDESGIIRVGAEVTAGDILVGKVTPKGEQQPQPEDRLLRAIFGEKNSEVRNTSLRVPPGVVGTVIDTKVFSRKGAEKGRREQDLEDAELTKIQKDKEKELHVIRQSNYNRLKEILVGQRLVESLVSEEGRPLCKAKETLTEEILEKIDKKLWPELQIEDAHVSEQKKLLFQKLEEREASIEARHKALIEKRRKGDDLAPGVGKMVKVYVAIKRKLRVGDKMAGRHGNKGVISRVLAVEDMPFLEDGTPVDMVLNPLGVPSRMNIGQILETHLGWAARGLGKKINKMLKVVGDQELLRSELKRYYREPAHQGMIDQMNGDDLKEFIESINRGVHVATPVFDGASEESLYETLELAGLDRSAQSTLFDGQTGRRFDNPVTVGVMYVLKLHHLVDDKIHARSTGPYSLVTQQPLGGKAQFGGQRLGEMEVWAMEAYGAAYTLQEFLTVKSDDVTGRTHMYESIVKGEFKLQSALPESFNVLIRELQSLALDIELLQVNDD